MEKNVVSKYSGKGKKVIICTLIIFLIILAFLMGAGLIYAGTIFGLISNN